MREALTNAEGVIRKAPFSPRLLAIELLLWGVLIIGTLLTLPDYGVSWDEQIRFRSGEIKWNYYAGLLSGEQAHRPTDHYPGLHDLTHVALVRVLGLDWILAGHGLSLAFGLAGVLAVRMAAVALGGRLAGILALLILIVGFPRYYGHMVINPKDIPFFAGYAWSLYFLLRMALKQAIDWKDALGWGLATGATLGMRVGGLLLWSYAGLLWLVLSILWIRSHRKAGIFGWNDIIRAPALAAGKLAVGSAVSLFVLFLCWPALHGFDAIEKTSATIETVQAFRWELHVLFDGHYYEAAQLPFYYLPWMFVITTALPVLLLAGAALLWGVWKMRTNLLSILQGKGMGMLLLAYAAWFPLLYVVFTGATVYNGIRHLLFILGPAAVILAVAGAWLWQRIFQKSPKVSIALAGVWLLALVPTALDLVRLHPYAYIYYNSLVGGVRGAEGSYEMDYWATAYKELMEAFTAHLDAQEHPENAVYLISTEHVTWLLEPYLPKDRPYTLILTRSQGVPADFYAAAIIREAQDYFAGDPVVSVERKGVLLAVIKDRRHLQGEEREMFYGME